MIIIASLYNYMLVQNENQDKEGYYFYGAYNLKHKNEKKYEKAWKTRVENLEDMRFSEIRKTKVYLNFQEYVNKVTPKEEKDAWSLANDDDDDYIDYDDGDENDISPTYYRYTPPKKTTGLKDKLMNSDTLVIHCSDNSTDMLSQIYQGQGWDVMADGNIDPKELHELIQAHKKIIMLGHGTGSGLLNVQGGGFVIDDSFAADLKQKETYSIWCFSSDYFRRNGFNKKEFHTGMIISEVGEETWALGDAPLNKEEMLKNITDWSKYCAEALHKGLSPQAQIDYVKARYTGTDKTSEFNRNHMELV